MTRQHTDQRISDAIERTWQTHPYYASAISRLRIVADRNVSTMATSKHWVTHYNPDTLNSWTTSEIAAVLVHELEHLLRKHSERCGNREHSDWNVAADAEINQRLSGLPDGAVYPETLGMPKGQSAEVMYAAAGGKRKQEPEPGEDAEDSQSEGDGSEGDGQPSTDGSDGKGGSGQPGDGPPNCGSSAGGPEQAHETGDADNPGSGAYSEDDVREEVAQDILQSQSRGTDPGEELRAWAERELGIDRAAWYAALAATVGHTMAPFGAPTRWQWPGRRDPRDMGGAMVPRWTGERPACAVIIDTSSSITPMDLEMAAAAGHYIGRVADVTYYACDTHSYRLGSTLPAQLPGGGGTDLRNGIAMAIEDGARAVVVITDCATPWPTEQTHVPIIVGANPGARGILSRGPLDPATGRWHPPEWMTVLPIMAEE